MFILSCSTYKPACLGAQSHSWCKFWVLRQDKDHQTQRVGAMAVLHWTTRNILSGSLAVTGNNQQEDLLTEVTENKIGTKINAKIQRLPDCSMWRLHGFTGFTLFWPFQTSVVPSLHPAKWPFFMFQALLSRLKQNSNQSSISFVHSHSIPIINPALRDIQIMIYCPKALSSLLEQQQQLPIGVNLSQWLPATLKSSGEPLILEYRK